MSGAGINSNDSDNKTKFMMKNCNNSMLMSGPIEVLIKTKWYRANAAISEHYLGISLDEEQPDGLWQVRKF